ncbi:MAG: hypothetical protein QY317_03115 [Candidatus Jettenia caeni]|nr:MAG: hypothetical protein QY317_03115 [Candidatus Jettenia caeni]
MKNIIVVANGDLKSIGRELVHAISKTKVAQASLFTPKQYANNEHQIGGTQYVIFLGKNEVSEDFIPLIQKKYETHGIVWGFDASKAVVYIESSNVELDTLKKEFSLIKEERENGTPIFLNNIIGILLYELWFKWFDPIYWISYLIKYKRKIKLTKELQMKLGIISFLKDGFDEFVKVDLA